MRGAFSAALRLPPPPPPSGKRNLGLLPSPARSLPVPRVSSAPKSLAGGSSANSDSHHHQSRKAGEGHRPVKKQEQDGDGADEEEQEEEQQQQEEEEKQVHCEVEVVSWRETRVRAWVAVNADVATLWGVLTDYERLAEYIPNLVHSGRIPCPHKGRIWLEQRGLQRGLYWQIEARVVLDLQEFPNSANGSELHFSMVDGDFKKFEGKWSVKAGPRSSMATLCYEVSVAPKFNFPAIFLERIIKSDLPVNLQALAFIAERNYEENQKLFMARGGLGTAFRTPYHFFGMSGAGSRIDTLLSKKNSPEPPFGTMAGSASAELNPKWGVYGKVCRLDRQCMIDEIHLRRFDGLLETGGAHRCVVASITIKAPVREVWSVLTSYEALPEIVPNLGISKILSRDNNKVRVLQEGCKGLLYMVLHARVILDLHEEFEHKISFEQVEGDFDSFRGKWLLEQLGDRHTLLKYVVESIMHKDTFLSEAILEEVIYEDLPSNLCAIRDFVESRVAVENDQLHYPDKKIVSKNDFINNSENKPTEVSSNSEISNNLRQRSKVPGLQRDIGVLRAELTEFISEYGKEGFMPMRKQLRAQGRVDIEKAITRMGGFRKIANLMNLSLSYKHRKPKGYWDNFENLQEEITRFQKSWGMDPTYMPSRKSFERAGRYDIARALEKWGGLQEVSRLLSLELRHPRKRPASEKEGNNDLKKPNDSHCQEKMSNKPYVAQDTQKWLMKLKDLDINWVE